MPNCRGASLFKQIVSPIFKRLRGIIPHSLFGRLVLGFLGISIPLLLITGLGFYQKTFAVLNSEAYKRLVATARLLASRIGTKVPSAYSSAGNKRLRQLFSAEPAFA